MGWNRHFEKFRHPQSLRMRLTLLVAALAVLVLLITSALISERAIDLIEQNPRQQLISASHTLSTTMTVWLESHVSALQNLLSLPDITSMNPQRQRPLLHNFAAAYPYVYLVSTTNLSGMNVARNDEEPPKDYSDRYWFLRARSGTPLVFESLIGRTIGRPALIVSMPIRRSSGEIVGVGMFATDLAQLTAQVHAAKLGQTGFAYLVDQEDRVIAHPDPAYASELRDLSAYPPVAALRNGTRGEVRFQDNAGRPWRSYVSQMKNGWGVVVQQQEDEWMLTRSLFQKVALGAIFSAVLVLMAATWWIVQRFLSPMEALAKSISRTAATEVIERTDLDALRQTLKGMRRKDEVGTLAESFDRMAERLQETLAKLGTELLQHRQTEVFLRESEEKYRTLVDHLNMGIYRNTPGPHGRFIQANPAMIKMFGYDSLEDFLRLSVSDLYQEAEDRSAFVRDITLLGSVRDKDLALRKKDGSPLWARVNAAAFYDASGKIQWIDGVIEDITEQKHAERALQDSEEKFRTLVDNVNVGITRISADQQGRVIQANQAMAKIFGYSDIAEAMASDITDHFNDLQEWRLFLTEMLSNGMVKGWEATMKKKDGTHLWISINATLQRDNKGRILWIDSVFEDVSERRKLEEQLAQAQKMEAIGTLAGGVAHDFNNILTAIIGYGNLLKPRIKPPNPASGYVDDILAAADRASNLTHSLLAFSRKQVLSPRTVDINAIVSRLEKLLLRVIGEDIEFKTILADEPLLIVADSGQIEQVLLNLSTNARDAMPDGGSLILRVDRVFISQTHPYLEPGPYALLSVSDTGSGIDEATRQRIFEPFFTTKERGKGTGLGLSIVYGIIKQHNGEIQVYSEPGKGTTFKIYLKLMETGVDSGVAETEKAPRGGTETILIAEDDPAVRRLMQSTLEQYGYSVIEAEDGEDAVAKFEAHRDEIRLVVLDVVMPKKNGKEAYDVIRRINSGVKVLFSSGYTADIIHKKGVLDEGLNFISKPVTPYHLLEKIRTILDR